jgi:hypothetical protein
LVELNSTSPPSNPPPIFCQTAGKLSLMLVIRTYSC